MAHDQQEIAALEDILFKRDQTVQALTCEVQAYRHRLLSYGIGVDECDAPPSEPQTPGTATETPTCASGSQFDSFFCDYPALRCADNSATDLDRYPSEETPRFADSPRDPFRHRNVQLERVRSGSFRSYKEKGVSVRQSPRRRWSYLRSLSYGSLSSNLEHQVDYASNCRARYDISDRVYTVDGVNGARANFVSTPRELHGNKGIEDESQEREFKGLYTRLQALEAGRELMRKSFLISMGTDKAQIALLRENVQRSCN